jgi:hypothetical protein
LNSEKIWKIWKKSRLNCEMIWKIQKKSKLKCEKRWKIQRKDRENGWWWWWWQTFVRNVIIEINNVIMKIKWWGRGR